MEDVGLSVALADFILMGFGGKQDRFVDHLIFLDMMKRFSLPFLS